MFIGRINYKYILALIVLGIATLSIFILIIYKYPDVGRFGTWKNRIENYKSGDSESNYQVEQAKIAIANGGLLGVMPGNSEQKNFLPHPYSDFIYAIVIEEFGLVGGIVVLLLYLILLHRAIRIVVKCPKHFGSFLTIGLSLSLVFQALINMAVAVNLVPVTGQTLPLVSMGGTSLWFTSIAIGMILSVSRDIENNIELQEAYAAA
jgi:cell division protein FtsW